MLPYLLALDLDGTACSDQGRLGARTKEALLLARKAGHRVCFATGRRDVDMFSFWEESRFADYLLLNNGGKLMETASRRILFSQQIDPQISKTLITYCLAHNHQLHVFSGDYWGINRWNESLQEYVDQLGAAPVRYRSLEETPYQAVDGFMATVDLEPVCRYIDQMGLPLSHTLSEERCVDIMAEGISKWSGLLRLASLLDIPRQQIIAAGDYNNDLDMIRNAGIGVAVQNALPEVKLAADYVTEYDNNHDAVADIVARFLCDGFC